MKKLLMALIMAATAATAGNEMCVLNQKEITLKNSMVTQTLALVCVDGKKVMLNPNGSTTQLFWGGGKSLDDVFCSCAETTDKQ